jgi:hypothetical protein
VPLGRVLQVIFIKVVVEHVDLLPVAAEVQAGGQAEQVEVELRLGRAGVGADRVRRGALRVGRGDQRGLVAALADEAVAAREHRRHRLAVVRVHLRHVVQVGDDDPLRRQPGQHGLVELDRLEVKRHEHPAERVEHDHVPPRRRSLDEQPRVVDVDPVARVVLRHPEVRLRHAHHLGVDVHRVDLQPREPPL